MIPKNHNNWPDTPHTSMTDGELADAIAAIGETITDLQAKLNTYQQHQGWRKGAAIEAKRRKLRDLHRQAQQLEAEIAKDET